MTVIRLLIAAGLYCTLVTAAAAEKRVALIVGNSAYSHVGRLANPANDAAAIETVLRKAGFDTVDSRRDLSISDTRKVLRDFTAKTRDADVAVIYYAGHGIEVDGINYIIPIDATLEQDTDIYDEAVSLDRILVAVEPAKKLRLVILDACRDNPFAKTMKRTLGSRAIGRGLAKVEPTTPNTMIAFAAKAGSTASDGASRNSPFATALVDHLPKPGLDLRKAFGFIRDDVMKATDNKQEPYVYGSLGGNDVSLVPSGAVLLPTAVAPPSSLPGSTNADARRDYDAAVTIGTQAVWEAFIVDYPRGLYTELAKAQRAKLLAEEARSAAAERSRIADEEKARLAADGARAAEQAKAAKAAKAADEVRIAAEKKKAAEDAKLAEAERAKTAAVAKAAEEARVAAEKKKAAEDAKLAQAERAKIAAVAKAAEEARVAAEKKNATDGPNLPERKREADGRQAISPNLDTDRPTGPVASVASDSKFETSSRSAENAIDIPRQVQAELRRVGCNTGAVTSEWNGAAQRALGLFNKHAGTTLDVKLASLDALDLVKSKTGRICPLVCESGYKADGDRCTKVTCRAGYEVGDNNACEKIEVKKPPTKRAPSTTQVAAPAAPSAQIICGNGGCRPIGKGCKLVQTRNGYAGNFEVCN
ncbi:caspase family protein [Tardiphaga sp. 215_C5_N2_1]|uniref:caspase family protein n=1 Tax=unclassified Tardiphaga TaxID=2631404 RepID=UPI000FF5735B